MSYRWHYDYRLLGLSAKDDYTADFDRGSPEMRLAILDDFLESTLDNVDRDAPLLFGEWQFLQHIQRLHAYVELNAGLLDAELRDDHRGTITVSFEKQNFSRETGDTLDRVLTAYPGYTRTSEGGQLTFSVTVLLSNPGGEAKR